MEKEKNNAGYLMKNGEWAMGNEVNRV